MFSLLKLIGHFHYILKHLKEHGNINILLILITIQPFVTWSHLGSFMKYSAHLQINIVSRYWVEYNCKYWY